MHRAAGVLVSQVKARAGDLELWLARDGWDRVAASFINEHIRGLYFGSRFQEEVPGIVFS